MPFQYQLLVGAAVLAGAGFLFLLLRRKAAHMQRGGQALRLMAIPATGVCWLAALGIVGIVLYPNPTQAPSEQSPPEAPNPTSLSPKDREHRKTLLGTWTDNYQGKRTMTLKEDGTGVMHVELEGLNALMGGKEMTFNMIWSIKDGRLFKKTISGKPADKVSMILKLFGDRVNEKILSLTQDQLILLDGNGKTRYTWTRVP